MVRAGLPQPIRRRLGIVAEALFSLPQRFFDPLAFGVLLAQCVVGPLELSNRAVELVARTLEQCLGVVLRGGQQTDEQDRRRDEKKPRYLIAIHGQRIERRHEIVVEGQKGERRGEQSRSQPTEPGAEHDGAQKQRYRRAHQMILQPKCAGERARHGDDSDGVPRHLRGR